MDAKRERKQALSDSDKEVRFEWCGFSKLPHLHPRNCSFHARKLLKSPDFCLNVLFLTRFYLHLTVGEVMTWVASLITQYGKLLHTKSSGSGAKELTLPQRWTLKNLKFLRSNALLRQTFSSVEVSAVFEMLSFESWDNKWHDALLSENTHYVLSLMIIQLSLPETFSWVLGGSQVAES